VTCALQPDKNDSTLKGLANLILFFSSCFVFLDPRRGIICHKAETAGRSESQFLVVSCCSGPPIKLPNQWRLVMRGRDPGKMQLALPRKSDSLPNKSLMRSWMQSSLCFAPAQVCNTVQLSHVYSCCTIVCNFFHAAEQAEGPRWQLSAPQGILPLQLWPLRRSLSIHLATKKTRRKLPTNRNRCVLIEELQGATSGCCPQGIIA
jgi:hypothetical protein